MSRFTLVTGGCRSGKSSFGESLMKDHDDVLYIATAVITDEEMEHRIKKHRERRNQKWKTLEAYKGLADKIQGCNEKYIFLDCVTIMVTNLMFDMEKDLDSVSDDRVDEITKEIKKEFTEFLKECRNLDKDVVLVTNEVGSGIVPENRLTRVFRDVQGFVNQHIGNLCDEVYFVCCGQALMIKGA